MHLPPEHPIQTLTNALRECCGIGCLTGGSLTRYEGGFKEVTEGGVTDGGAAEVTEGGVTDDGVTEVTKVLLKIDQDAFTMLAQGLCPLE